MMMVEGKDTVSTDLPQVTAPEILRALRKRAGFSRDRLAKAIGMARGSSFNRYEDPAYWTAEKYPSDFIAKIAHALVGKGEPRITPAEVWALSEDSASVVLTEALILVPVAKWPETHFAGAEMAAFEVVGSMKVDAAPDGNIIAFQVADDHAAPRVANGSRVLVRLDDTMPTPGGVFMVSLEHGVEMRRYRTNPERWESLASPPAEVFYPKGAVVVIGRVWRTIEEFPL